jgi:hypothetical protein
MTSLADYLDSAVAENDNCDEGDAEDQMRGLETLLKENRVPFGGRGSPLPEGEG